MPKKQTDLSKLRDEEYCYLTTIGRVSGKPHKIEIWFGLLGETLYLLSGSHDSDWVKNLKREPAVKVKIAKYTFKGQARLVGVSEEQSAARPMLAAKYQNWHAGQRLSQWARDALVVAIDLKSGA